MPTDGGVTGVATEWRENCGHNTCVQYLCTRFVMEQTQRMHLWFTCSQSGKCGETEKWCENEISQSKDPSVEQHFYACFYGAQNVDFFQILFDR